MPDVKTVVIFYDAVRSHLTCSVINKLYNANIVVIAFPAHPSNCLQFLDVSMFDPFEIYVRQSYQDRLERTCSRFMASKDYLDRRFGKVL